MLLLSRLHVQLVCSPHAAYMYRFGRRTSLRNSSPACTFESKKTHFWRFPKVKTAHLCFKEERCNRRPTCTPPAVYPQLFCRRYDFVRETSCRVAPCYPARSVQRSVRSGPYRPAGLPFTASSSLAGDTRSPSQAAVITAIQTSLTRNFVHGLYFCTVQVQLKAREAIERAKRKAQQADLLRKLEEETARERLEKIKAFKKAKVRATDPRCRPHERCLCMRARLGYQRDNR